ncbi:hypothetical protein GOP47_0024432 [Adiantum capillus-veneris]|uniref:Uncharacterized protein n=1 Tax=Adiantum capillus-veneris TaxID=13818 RepID=A0A9D4U2N5_ADICA|nr:hypothetical protein GOP47_0024432 [Adiantum capillus-veneris]
MSRVLPHCLFHLLRVNPSAEEVLKGGTQLHRPVSIFPPLRSTALNWGTCWRMWFVPMKLFRVAHREGKILSYLNQRRSEGGAPVAMFCILPCSVVGLMMSSFASASQRGFVICRLAGLKIADIHSLRVRAGLRLLWRLQTSIRLGDCDFHLVLKPKR